MGAADGDGKERLLKALAEQLKIPFIRIAREAELAHITGVSADARAIEYTADMALRLIDSYLLSVQLQAVPSLELEPVSVSAMLHDTAQRLNLLAKQYDCELEVHLSGKYGPVMAHRQSLEAAYMNLGYAFIESAPDQATRHRVVLALHKSAKGLVAGVFGERQLQADGFKRAKALYGHSQQAMPSLLAANGAGMFVADALLQNMATPLRTARHQKLSGLAATLLPSNQLQLV